LPLRLSLRLFGGVFGFFNHVYDLKGGFSCLSQKSSLLLGVIESDQIFDDVVFEVLQLLLKQRVAVEALKLPFEAFNLLLNLKGHLLDGEI
jgi:hypothetical protein